MGDKENKKPNHQIEDYMNEYYEFLFKVEGGKSNHKNDRGGKTNFGITQFTYDSMRKQYPQEFKNFPEDVYSFDKDYARQYIKIYISTQIKGVEKIQNVGLKILYIDFSINSGNSNALKCLQKVLNLKEDGLFGPDTTKKVNELNDGILEKYIDERRNFLGKLLQKNRDQEVFRKGWYNRVDDISQFAYKMQSKQRQNQNQVGGVDMNVSISQIRAVRGVKFAFKGKPKFIIDNKLKFSYNQIQLEDLALCLQVQYDNTIKYQGISFSLDPWEETNPKSNGEYQRKVFYPDCIENKRIIESSRFGELMFECDYIMKKMSIGFESDCITPFQYPEELTKLGLKPTYQIQQQQNQQSFQKSRWSRYWIVCRQVNGVINEEQNGIIILNDIQIGIDARQMEQDIYGKLVDKVIQDVNDPCYIFARKFSQLYPIISKYYPCFKEMANLYKALALAKWIFNKKTSIKLEALKQVSQKQFQNNYSYKNYIKTIQKKVDLGYTENIINFGTYQQIEKISYSQTVLGGVDLNCEINEIQSQLSTATCSSFNDEFHNNDLSEVDFIFYDQKYCQICKKSLSEFEMQHPHNEQFYCCLDHPFSCAYCHNIIYVGKYCTLSSQKKNNLQQFILLEQCVDRFQSQFMMN